MRELLENLLRGTSERMVMLRFLAVGGTFTLIYSLGSALLTSLSVAPEVASIVMYVACLLPSYLTQKKVAFRSSNRHTYSFPRYAALQAFLMVIGAALSSVLVRRAGWNPLLAFLLIGPSVAALSFFVQRTWTFAEQAPAEK